MNYILLNRFGVPTMRQVQAQMKEPCRLMFDSNTPLFYNTDIVIRWANSEMYNTRGAKIINKRDGIKLACNKAKSRIKMQDEGISVPKSWNNFSEASLPCIMRPTYHRKGENFHIIQILDYIDEIEDNNGNYYSEIIDKKAEYRVHVAHGKVLYINQKPLIEGEIRANQHVTHQSWGKVLSWEDYRRKMCKLACDAVKCCGLDMGGVDIMKSKDKKYYVCEVNTAPTFTNEPYAVERYAKYFDWLFRHRDAVWWDYSKYEAGASFAWKNLQLEA